MRTLSTALFLTALGSVATAQERVWTVDDDGGRTNADFQDLQAAIDHASDGDLILVRSGTYDRFQIEDKSLTITADTGAEVTVGDFSGSSSIANLAVSRSVVIRDLRITGALTLYEEGSALHVHDNKGRVWLEGCTIDQGQDNLVVEDSFSVSLARCVVQGADQILPEPELGVEGFPASPAVIAHRSHLGVYGSRILGGEAAVFDLDALFEGESQEGGAPGLMFSDGALHLAGSFVFGGEGSDPLQLDGTVWASEQASELGPEEIELPVVGSFEGQWLPIPGGVKEILVRSPVREGELATFSLRGEPGDTALMAVTLNQHHAFLPRYDEVFTRSPNLELRGFGVVPAEGMVTKTLRIEELGMDWSRVYLTPVFFTSEGLVVGTPTALITLDSSY